MRHRLFYRSASSPMIFTTPPNFLPTFSASDQCELRAVAASSPPPPSAPPIRAHSPPSVPTRSQSYGYNEDADGNLELQEPKVTGLTGEGGADSPGLRLSKAKQNQRGKVKEHKKQIDKH